LTKNNILISQDNSELDLGLRKKVFENQSKGHKIENAQKFIPFNADDEDDEIGETNQNDSLPPKPSEKEGSSPKKDTL